MTMENVVASQQVSVEKPRNSVNIESKQHQRRGLYNFKSDNNSTEVLPFAIAPPESLIESTAPPASFLTRMRTLFSKSDSVEAATVPNTTVTDEKP
jgi:hypothetical protein